MKTILTSPRPSRKPSLFSFETSRSQIKVSLHHLVEQLLVDLQPLAMRRDNVVVNGIPEGISFLVEENLLAYVLWNLLSAVINTKQGECIYVQTLVDDERTFVGVKDAGTYLYRYLAPEFRKLQHAAEQIGASIDWHNDHDGNANIVLSMCNRRLAI